MLLTDFLVCDDIRHEVGGKITLVGIYVDGITVSVPAGQPMLWPVKLPKLGVFARVRIENNDFAPDSFELTFHHGDNLVGKFEGAVSVRDPSKPLNIALAANGFILPGPGVLRFEVIFKKGDKRIRLEPHSSLEISQGAA